MFNSFKQLKKIILAVSFGLLMLVNFSPVSLAQNQVVSGGVAATTQSSSPASGVSVGAQATKVVPDFWSDPIGALGNMFTASAKAVFAAMWGTLVYSIATIIAVVASKVLVFLGFLIGFIFDMNNQIATSPFVLEGWTFLRNLSNLGFVLAIIFIAFATMLRIESYGIKKLFVRLIVVAVLINFSLAISGVVLTFTNSLTGFFAEISASGLVDKKAKPAEHFKAMALELANATKVQSLLRTTETSYDTYAFNFDLSKDFISTFISLVFAAGFTVLVAGSFAAITIVSFLRYFIISGLLILAPLAWLSFVVPPVDYFKQWWQKLLQWSFFMPTMMFFLYLAIIFADAGGGLNTGANAPNSPHLLAQKASTDFLSTVLGPEFGNYARMLMTLSIIIMGLIVGEKMGVGMSKTGLVAASWAKKVAIGTVGVGAGWSARRLLAMGVDEKGKTFGERFAAGISRAPVIGTVFGGVARGIDKYSRPIKTAPDEIKKELGSLNDGLLVAEANNKFMRGAEAAAYIKELAGRKGKLLKQVDTERLKFLMKEAALFGVKEDIYKQRLDLVPDEDVEKMVKKLDPKKFLEEVDDDMLKEVRFVKAMSTKQKDKLINDGSDTFKSAYVEGLNNLAQKMRDGNKQISEISKDEHINYALQNTGMRNAIEKSLEKNAGKLPLMQELINNSIRPTAQPTVGGAPQPLFSQEEIDSRQETKETIERIRKIGQS